MSGGPETALEWLLALAAVVACAAVGSAIGKWLAGHDWTPRPPRSGPFAPVRCGACGSEFPQGYWHSCRPAVSSANPQHRRQGMSSVAFKVWETEYPEDGHTVVCAETKEEAIASLRKAGQFADADEVDASRAPELDWLAGADGSEEGVLRAAMAEARAALEASPPDVERARKALLYAAQD